MKLDYVTKLAEDHWGYVAEVLRNHNVAEDIIAMSEFHYLSAFVHGYKHAVEDGEKKDVVPSNEDWGEYMNYEDLLAGPYVPPNQPVELPEVYGGGS